MRLRVRDFVKTIGKPPVATYAEALAAALYGPQHATPVECYRRKWRHAAGRDVVRAAETGEDIATAAERISRRWHGVLTPAQLETGARYALAYAARRAQVRAVVRGKPAVAFVAGIGLGMPDPDEPQPTLPPFRWINAGEHG